MRYAPSRDESFSPPPPSSRTSRDPAMRGMKRMTRRSPSPERRRY